MNHSQPSSNPAHTSHIPAGGRYLDSQDNQLVVVLGPSPQGAWCWSPGASQPFHHPAEEFRPGGRFTAAELQPG
jgi:hypothetical protein